MPERLDGLALRHANKRVRVESVQWSRPVRHNVAGCVHMLVQRRLHRSDVQHARELVRDRYKSMPEQRQLHHGRAQLGDVRVSDAVDGRLLHAVHVLVHVGVLRQRRHVLRALAGRARLLLSAVLHRHDLPAARRLVLVGRGLAVPQQRPVHIQSAVVVHLLVHVFARLHGQTLRDANKRVHVESVPERTMLRLHQWLSMSLRYWFHWA